MNFFIQKKNNFKAENGILVLGVNGLNVVELKNINKSFGDNQANKNVSFDLKKGEIHALLGENGAGKSTLMNILYGLYQCDSGEIYIKGNLVSADNPKVAIANGVGMVHQHFMLIPQLSVTENIFLGMKESGFFLKMKDLEKQVLALNKRFGFDVNPKTPVWQLPVGLQQKVEILKALIRKVDILILDEPTAVLTPQEVKELFSSIKQLTKEGYSVILITHKMEEVMDYCDRVTVMRAGEVVDTVALKDTDKNALAEMMVGRKVYLDRNLEAVKTGDTILKLDTIEVKNEKGLSAVDGLSLELKKGEVLGIAGVDGNGQLELGEAIIGLRKIESGHLYYRDEDRTNAKPKEMISLGMAHIPEDRHKKGLILPFTLKENLILGSQSDNAYKKGLLMDYKKIDAHAEKLMEDFDIRPRNYELTGAMLSGGNQQKVIFAREISRNPEMILALQPTRGLDIGAIEFVRNKLLEERKKGKGILLISTDLDEIISLSDRIAVIYKGKIIGEVDPQESISQIGLLMSGVKRNMEEGGAV